MRKSFLFILLFLFCSSLSSQKENTGNPKIDSLLNLLRADKPGKSKVDLLVKTCTEFIIAGYYEKALHYGKEAMNLAGELNYKKGLADAYDDIGIAYDYKGDYNKASEFYFKALGVREESGIKEGLAGSYTNIGNTYYSKRNYAEALEFHFKALKIHEATADKSGMSGAFTNIGNVYFSKNDHDKSLEFYLKSLKIDTETGDQFGMSVSYNNSAGIYFLKGRYNEALQFYSEALKIREEMGDRNGVAASHINIGSVYFRQKKFSEARTYLNKGFEFSRSIGAKEWVQNACQVLASLDSATGNLSGAYEYHKLYSLYKDSLYNEESHRQITEMQTRYDSEKKEQQIELLGKEKEKDRVVAEEKNRRQQIIIWSVAGGLILVLVFAGFVVFSLRKTRKQKKLIEKQKQIVEKQKHFVEEKQKEILDSIYYARRIQRALITNEKYIEKNLFRLKKHTQP
ncbi:MAG: tetratricopeptide repeat protein [Bacteroidia bacterium]|nr:tetratricopeptide repeat protein [Bacteroidia bacterium]